MENTPATENPSPERSAARSREEVRADAKPLGLADQARMIQDRLEARRSEQSEAQAEDDAYEHSDAPEPATAEAQQDDVGDADDEYRDDDTDSEGHIESLDELLSALEVDEDAFGALKTKLKIEGEEVEVTLSEVLKNHQFAARNTQRAQELAANQRRFEAEKTEQIQVLKQAIDQGKAYHQAAYQVLQAEIQSPEVQQLEQTDPGAFLQYHRHAQQRVAQLEHSYNQLLAQESAAGEQFREERLRAGRQRLRESIPDFDTDERRKKIVSVFTDRGVAPQELDSLMDERIIQLVSDYADLQEKVSLLEAREAQAQKVARPAVKAPPKGRPGKARRKPDSKKRLEQAKDAIRNSKGRNRIRANQAAFLEKLRTR